MACSAKLAESVCRPQIGHTLTPILIFKQFSFWRRVLYFREVSSVTLGCTDGANARRRPTPDGLSWAILGVWTTCKPCIQRLTIFSSTLRRHL